MKENFRDYFCKKTVKVKSFIFIFVKRDFSKLNLPINWTNKSLLIFIKHIMISPDKILKEEYPCLL